MKQVLSVCVCLALLCLLGACVQGEAKSGNGTVSQPEIMVNGDAVITEAEVMEFYDTYVTKDVFNFLVHNTFEDVKRDGIPYYVLYKLGVPCIDGELENFDETYATVEELVQLEAFKIFDSQIYYVFRPEDIQDFVDSIWGSGRLDVQDWYNSGEYFRTSKGYIFSASSHTGFGTREWIQPGAIILDGSKAILEVYCLRQVEFEACIENIAWRDLQQPERLSRSHFVLVASDDSLSEELWEHTFDDVIVDYGIDLEALLPMPFTFYMSPQGIRLENAGPGFIVHEDEDGDDQEE